jgi:hypothetical protein
MIILGSQIPIVHMEYPYTLPRCALGNHYKVVQCFHLTCNVPTEVSLSVCASHPPRSPLLSIVGSSHRSCTHTIPMLLSSQLHRTSQCLYHRSFRTQSVGTPRLDSTTYYSRPYPYRLMVVLFSWVVTP